MIDSIHILHLLYISLHPAHEISLNDDDEPLDRTALLTQSPRKIIKQTKSALILTPEAVLSARRLLMSFVLTNAPEDLGTALPQYPETKNAPPMEFEYMDSPIFKQSEAIKSARNCWEILKSGYRLRKLQMYAFPKGKGKGKQTRNLFTSEPSFVAGDDGQEILPVDDDAWSTLNWLLTLFEHDADLMEARGECEPAFVYTVFLGKIKPNHYSTIFPAACQTNSSSFSRNYEVGYFRTSQTHIFRHPTNGAEKKTNGLSPIEPCTYLSPFLSLISEISFFILS